MGEDRLFNSLDSLGPPFQIDTSNVTHSNIPATMKKIRTLYGVSGSLTPKVGPKSLAMHGFNHWMVPKVDTHPYLPPKPGFPGIILQSDEGLEAWRPEDGTAFRVVVRREAGLFEYIGQYEMLRLGDVREDEWKEPSAEVRPSVHTGFVVNLCTAG